MSLMRLITYRGRTFEKIEFFKKIINGQRNFNFTQGVVLVLRNTKSGHFYTPLPQGVETSTTILNTYSIRHLAHTNCG